MILSPRTKSTLVALVLMAVVFGIVIGVKSIGNATISVVNGLAQSVTGTTAIPQATPLDQDPEYAMPDNDSNRLDILLLGIRGADDVQNGGMLTDTILLFSMDKTTGVSTLTSIPRDLTVRITDTKTEKINAAYPILGLAGTKELFSRITGVKIDNAVVIDFNAFKSVVDTLGGITITLDKPFSEAQQWAGTASDSYVFSLPAGVNNLNGDQALYYARSRYSSSDFDRARRQMQIIMAIKQKAVALNLTSDPLKALQVILAVRSHITTDLNIFDIGTLKDLITRESDIANIKRYQLTTENLLYETTASGTYELLPRDHTLAHIKTFFQTVLTNNPVLPTPAPALASPRQTSLTPTPTP